MDEPVVIRPSGEVRGAIRPPGSKSITNRALLCAAMAEGESILGGAGNCDDVRAMIEGLQRLGAVVERDPATAAIHLVGRGGKLPDGSVELYAADSGVTARFLTAVAALGSGTYRIDGSSQMRRRPMKELLDALGRWGAEAVSESGNGRLPVVIRGGGLHGGRVTLPGGVSSQFVSALLMAAPYAESDVEISVSNRLVSRPFVDMTAAVMSSFGAGIEETGPQRFAVSASRRYRGRRYEIEPDATAASYFFAAAAIAGGEVTVEGFSRDGLQGDLAFCECLRRMGCEVRYETNGVTVSGRPLRGIDADLGALSDTVPTLAAAALMAEGPTRIRGVGHIRRKESNRIAELAAELRKFGAEVEEHADGLTIIPRPLRGAEVDPHDDHRLAMSLSLVGLAVEGVTVQNPDCVRKTYPGFFRDLVGLRALM